MTTENPLRSNLMPVQAQSERDRVSQTVLIATATRRELESMCVLHGLSVSAQPTATLRQALRQHLLTQR